MTQKRRLCVKCGEEKSIRSFEPRADTGGHRNACRKCLNTYRTERWRMRNKEKYDKQIAFQKKYPGQKQCIKCENIKDIERFNIHKTATDGRRNICKVCQNIYAQIKRQKDDGRSRNYSLQRDHGISHEEYLQMLESQGGRCMICNTDKPHRSLYFKHFAIDHCHKSGKIRALLCNSCNTGIGHFNDDSDLLKKAINYLDSFNS